jgi:hypothetical protein
MPIDWLYSRYELSHKAKTLQSVTPAKAGAHLMELRWIRFRRKDKKKGISGITNNPGWITSNQQKSLSIRMYFLSSSFGKPLHRVPACTYILFSL